MNHWLVKSEPGTYSFSDLEKDKTTNWDGVRNYQARNNLKAMQNGDALLFYHSVKEKAIVGLAQVSKTSFQDPTTEDNKWVAVEIKPVRKLKTAVALEKMKTIPELSEMALFKQSRLSVIPVTEKEFQILINISEKV